MLMKKAWDLAETALNAVGVMIGVSDVENVLNLVLLIVSIIAILWRAGYAIYTHIKNNRLDEVGDELDKAKDDIEKLTKPKEDKEDGGED